MRCLVVLLLLVGTASAFNVPKQIRMKRTKAMAAAQASEDLRMKRILETTQYNPNDFLGVNKLTFPNGVTVVHKEDTSAPTFSMIFSYHVGSRHENEENQGVAHLLEHMLFKGTRRRPLQWGRLFYALGSMTNAMTTYGLTAYFHTAHKSSFEPLLELEIDRMKNVTLDITQLDREKRVVMSELTGDRNSPLMILNEKVMEAAFPGFWPSRSIGGKTVMDLNQQHANEFYLAGYRPGCLTVSVVGDINWEELIAKLDKAGLVSLGMNNLHEIAQCSFDIPKPVAVTNRPGYNIEGSDEHKVMMKDPETDTAILEYVVPLTNLTDLKATASINILDALFNGGVLTDVLQGAMQKPVEAGVLTTLEEDAGWMNVFVIVPGGTFDDLLLADDTLSGANGLFEQLGSNVSSPLSPMLLAAATAAVVDAERRDWFSSSDSLALHLAIDETITGDFMYTQRLLNTTKSLTVDDVVEVAGRFFRKDKLIVGTHSPGTGAEAEETASRYGGVEKYTEHESVNNTAEYFKDLKCNIAKAEDVLRYVAELRYEGPYTEMKVDGEKRGLSVPIAPTLCFEEKEQCPNPESYAPPRPLYLRLNNGMQLLTHTDPTMDQADSSFISGFIDAGMEFDPPEYEGTSLMTSVVMQLNVQMFQMMKMFNDMFGGDEVAAAQFSKGDIPKATDKMMDGMGQVGIAPQLEGMSIQGIAPCGALDSSLEALHHALTNSQMLSAQDHSDLQKMVGQMVGSMTNDPMYAVRQVLLSEIYPEDHPQVRGPTEASVNRIPVELIQKFYINRVCPENTKITVVSGSYGQDPTTTMTKLASLFEKWPRCDVTKAKQANATAEGGRNPTGSQKVVNTVTGTNNNQARMNNFFDSQKVMDGLRLVQEMFKPRAAVDLKTQAMTSLLRRTTSQAQNSRLPRQIQALRARSKQSRRLSSGAGRPGTKPSLETVRDSVLPKPDSSIPGLSTHTRGKGIDDLGSALSLAWLDLGRALSQRDHKFLSGVAPADQQRSGAVGRALRSMADGINKFVIPKYRQRKHVSPMETLAQMSSNLPFSQVSLDAKKREAFHEVESAMNKLRARVDRVTKEQLPPALVGVVSKEWQKTGPHIPSLQQLVQDAQDSGGLGGEDPTGDAAGGGEEIEEEGTNSQPEPSRGGMFGTIVLPEIPRFPYYPPPKERAGVVWIRRKVIGLHEAMTVMMVETVRHGDPDYVPMMVANHITGGNSLSGKLGYWVRDCKGLTYHIASHLSVGRRSGQLVVEMQTQTGAALDQAVNDTLNIFQRVKSDGFTSAELDAAKRNLMSTATIEASDARSVADRILMDMVHSTTATSPDGSEDANMWTSLTQHLTDLDVRELNNAAKRGFIPRRFVIISLAEDLEDDYYPNHEFGENGLTPQPQGTRTGDGEEGGEDGGCQEKPEMGPYVPPRARRR